MEILFIIINLRIKLTLFIDREINSNALLAFILFLHIIEFELVDNGIMHANFALSFMSESAI